MLSIGQNKWKNRKTINFLSLESIIRKFSTRLNSLKSWFLAKNYFKPIIAEITRQKTVLERSIFRTSLKLVGKFQHFFTACAEYLYKQRMKMSNI